MLLDPEYDDELDIRQYAIASFNGPAAVYTGSDCEDWQGTWNEEHMAAAGNILTGEAVIDDAVAAYHDSAGDPFAERLLAALVAGGEQGGDSRCDCEVAAESAFLFVAEPDDGRYTIDLTASDKDGAVWALEQKYADGKRRNLHCSHAGGGVGGWGLLGLAALLWRRRG